jgi:hypothetical protein
MISLYLAAVLLSVACALSLFAKTEGFRGSGRVAGGLSTILLCVFLFTSVSGQPALFTALTGALLLTGLVTVGSGARKFMRRNIQ